MKSTAYKDKDDPECANPEVGGKLDLYELDLLEEGDKRRFELHLFTCNHCFEQVRKYSAAFEALRDTPEELLQLSDIMENSKAAPAAEARELSAGHDEPQGTAVIRKQSRGIFHEFVKRLFPSATSSTGGFGVRPAIVYALALGAIALVVAMLLPKDMPFDREDVTELESDSTRRTSAFASKDSADASSKGRDDREDRAEPSFAQLALIEAAPYASMSLLGVGDEDVADSLFRIGMQHYVDKRYSIAAASLSLVVALRKDDAEPLLYLGICKLMLSRSAEALGPLETATRHSEGVVHRKAQWYLAQACLSTGDGARAETVLSTLIDASGPYAAEAREQIRGIRALRGR